jgi:hypothetical protein
MSDYFEPKGAQARWQTCYDIVAETEVGLTITYAQIEHECGCGRGAAQAAMIEANKRLGRDGLNTVLTVTNIGWKVLKPDEAVPLVKRQRAKAERADDRTAGRINALQRRRGELTHDNRQIVDFEQRVMLAKAEINGRRKRETRTFTERAAELERNAPKRLRGA